MNKQTYQILFCRRLFGRRQVVYKQPFQLYGCFSKNHFSSSFKIGGLIHLVLFLLFSSVQFRLSAQEAKSLYEEEYCTFLSDFKFLIEKDKSLAINDIIDLKPKLQSNNPDELRISPDYAVWLNIEIPQSIDTSGQYFLAIGEFDEITFYFPTKHYGLKEVKNGKLIRPSERAIDKIPIAFPVDGSLAGQSCWAKIVHYNPLDKQLIQPCLLSDNNFNLLATKTNQSKILNSIVIGVLGGLLFAFLIYPITFYFFNKRVYFVYYSVYIILNVILLIFTSEKCGYLDLFFSNYPELIINLEPTLYSFSAIFYFLFLRSFILSINKSKAIDLALKILVVYETFIWLLDTGFKVYLNEMNLAYKVLGWFMIPILFLLFYVIYKLFLSRVKVLTFFAIGMSVVTLGLILSSAFFAHNTAFSLGSIFNNFHIFYHLGIVVELFFFSLALSQANQDYRNRQLTNELSLKSQITDLEKKALQAQMNPHFIFNCLASIQLLIFEKDADNAMRYLVCFSKLVRGTLDASVAGEVNLQEEMELLKNYLELEKLRFGDAFDYEIKVDTGLGFSNIVFSPMLLQPYVENAVVHGMQQKEKGGMVIISFDKKGKSIFATITDNGPGITQTSKLNTNHKSVGMSITRRRLELMHQVLGEDGLVQAEEVFDEKGEVAGTRVQVRLK